MSGKDGELKRRRWQSAKGMREEMDMPGLDEGAVRRLFMRPAMFKKGQLQKMT